MADSRRLTFFALKNEKVTKPYKNRPDVLEPPAVVKYFQFMKKTSTILPEKENTAWSPC